MLPLVVSAAFVCVSVVVSLVVASLSALSDEEDEDDEEDEYGGGCSAPSGNAPVAMVAAAKGTPLATSHDTSSSVNAGAPKARATLSIPR